MGLVGLTVARYLGLYGILSGLTKSTDHPSRVPLKGSVKPVWVDQGLELM